MSDDFGFDPDDPIDDALRRRFGTGAPDGSDPDAVLDSMRPRLRRARTQRRAAIAGALGGAAVVVVVLLVVLGGGGGGTGSVRTPPASRSPVHTAPSTPTTTATGGPPTLDTIAGDDHGKDRATGDPAVSAPDATAPTVPAPETPPATQPQPSQPSQSSYTSDGGSIVVAFTDGRISLVSNTPATGYTAEIHDDGPTRVEVRFANGQREWRIRIDVVNGQLVPEITPH
jgi:hypothetical protein